jgi:hypothetical protein
MARSTAAHPKRHLWLVGPPTVYGNAEPLPAYPYDDGLSEDLWLAGFDVAIPPEASADRRWVACERPDARLRHGAYLCSCSGCVDALRRMVTTHRRPNLTLIIVTEADRIVTSARELLAQLDAGRGYEPFMWVVGDRVQHVYVGRGSSHSTVSEAHLAWRARARRDGSYPPRPRLTHADAPSCWHPSIAPTSTLALALPVSLERAVRAQAEQAGVSVETWIHDVLASSCADHMQFS